MDDDTLRPVSPLGLGAVAQVSFAVGDLLRVLPAYEALFGPFELGRVPLAGEREMIVGFARAGTVEIELVQAPPGRLPQAGHVARHGDGIHHVGFYQQTLAPARAALLGAGYRQVAGSEDFGYFELPDVLGYSLVEIGRTGAADLVPRVPVPRTGVDLALGAMDQVSFAVRDLDAVLPTYEALFGPFDVRVAVVDRLWYRGRESRGEYRLGFARSGDLEIELVQVTAGDAPQADHLHVHGEGLQHVRFRVADLDGARARMEQRGYRTVVFGEPPGVRFAYLELPADLGYTMVELIQRR
ncbi:MAG: VOC family protein [Gammaproteobacteria bacterium]